MLRRQNSRRDIGYCNFHLTGGIVLANSSSLRDEFLEVQISQREMIKLSFLLLRTIRCPGELSAVSSDLQEKLQGSVN